MHDKFYLSGGRRREEGRGGEGEGCLPMNSCLFYFLFQVYYLIRIEECF